MKKVYLAGPCDSENRTLMTKVAKVLRARGDMEVYCPFELKIPNAWDISQEEWAEKVFKEDIRNLNSADVFIMISTGRESTAGTNWEQGYAFALDKWIYVFQITDKPTSLMTYCGADRFFNIENEFDLYRGLKSISFNVDISLKKGFCSTVLT